MNTYSLERIQTEDGVELCGLMSTEPSRGSGVVVYTHGLAGNFYEQLFIDYLASAAVASGWRFLSFNNRGHDYFSDAYVTRDGRRSTLPKGGARERLTDWTLDISAAITHTRQLGCRRIALAAHSTGCVKIARYLLDKQPNEIDRLLLLSPSDDVGIQAANAGPGFEESLQRARELSHRGKGSELLPDGTFFYPIDADAYLALFSPDSPGNVFDVTGRGNRMTELAQIQIPTLVVLGSEDIAIVGNKELGVTSIAQALGAGVDAEFALIDGADHSYAGKEGVLGERVLTWMRKLDARTR